MASPPRALDTAAAWSWRILVVAAGILATVLLLARLRLVVLPVFAACLIAIALRPIARFLEHRRVPKGLATAVAFLAFFGALGGVGTLVGKGIGDQADDFGPTLSQGIDDVERWLVEGPLNLEQRQINEFRQQVGSSIRQAGTSGFVRPAIAIGEVLAGTLLALVSAFFLVKDGPELEKKALRRIPERHRDAVRRSARAARRALGGYLKGAALLGLVEGVIIGIAVALVGGELVLPIALLTFVGAFVPVVGAITTGIIATLVTLVTAGPREALIVAVVALVVQQLDSDILAPFIYGKSVQLHPLAILLSIATGATLAGIAGTFLAVPVAAVGVAVAGALRHKDDPNPSPAAGGSDVEPSGDGQAPPPEPAPAVVNPPPPTS